jgi:hypothetical protein
LWGLLREPRKDASRNRGKGNRREFMCLKQPDAYAWIRKRAFELGGTDDSDPYAWLREKGYVLRGKYDDVNALLLMKLGIARIITDLVSPIVDERFVKPSPDFLKDLESCWNQGLPPRMSFLHKVEDPFPFLEVNLQYAAIRFGQFAGLWFEEIQPSLRSQGG